MTYYALPSSSVSVSAHYQALAPSHYQPHESGPTQVTSSTLADILSVQAQRCQLPLTEPGMFKGDRTTFCISLNDFQAYVRPDALDPEDGAVSQYPPFVHFVQVLSREASGVRCYPEVARTKENKRAQPKQRNARVLSSPLHQPTGRLKTAEQPAG